MNYWDSVGRWINTLLVFIVGVLAFDALFRLLEANEANVIVSSVRALSVAFLVPFQGMFGEQDFVLTTLIGVLGYSLLAGIALGVLRSLQASRAQPAPPVQQQPPPPAVAPPSAARRSQAPPASAAQAAPRAASRTAAKEQSAPARDGGGQNRRRTPPPASSTPPSASTRERTDGQRRANGRRQRPRPEPETREGARRGDQPERRTAGRRRTPRGTDGTTRS